jgi:hypothetical protein
MPSKKWMLNTFLWVDRGRGGKKLVTEIEEKQILKERKISRGCVRGCQMLKMRT